MENSPERLSSYLDVVFNYREKVDKLDVSREEERSGGDTAQVVLGVEKAELNSGTTPWISSYEVTKLSHDVASHLHHVLMHCLGLQSLNKILISVSCSSLSLWLISPRRPF